MEQRGREWVRGEAAVEDTRFSFLLGKEVLTGYGRSRNGAMEGGERRRMSNEDAPSERLNMFGGENKIESVASRPAFQPEQQSQQLGQGGSKRDQVWEEKRRKAMDRSCSCLA